VSAPSPSTVDPGPVFAALADPTRRSVLTRLAAHGAASATALARELPVTRQAVVQHLAVLDAAGLTRARRHGREVRHALRPEALTATATWMTLVAAQWDERLTAIADIAEGRLRRS
jgi:DNA-binding transcriptional ArsR family regulator